MYPVFSIDRDGRSEDHLKRIEKLERYIRSLGGDLEDVEQPDESGNEIAEDAQMIGQVHEPRKNDTTPSTYRASLDSTPKTTEAVNTRTSGLVSHNEELTYIET